MAAIPRSFRNALVIILLVASGLSAIAGDVANFLFERHGADAVIAAVGTQLSG